MTQEQAVQNNNNYYIDQHEHKVVLTIKYKIYLVLLIIIMAITRWYMSDSVAQYDGVKNNIATLQNQKMLKESEYQQVVKDLLVLKDISAQKAAVVTCLSTKWCTTLPESLRPVASQTRAFLQLQKNTETKMAFDQKKILANINEYLLKWNNNQSNGVVTSISFGNLTKMDGIENVVQVAINLTIDFANKDGLLSFVFNVENTLSPQYPMLYKISSINYDIVKYQENQTVSIELVGYMIK